MALTPEYRVRSRSMPVFIAAGVILFLGAASGCASSTGSGEPPCFPPSFLVKPATAKAGERVTVTAPDADCNPHYGDNARIRVTVNDAMNTNVIDVTAPMNDAGGFTYTFEVPSSTAVGDAAVSAIPDNIDWCDDTGKNNRAGGAAVTLQRASCVMPMKPLTVTR
ncbi:hypothetical protein [Arthrobacter sp. SO3]|uniref:hypothetical protein n=1 Tax=Arthrobacter sp. SO3 TaxID=1897057 RepID=UPI001CFFA63A|nr:hypothetical protein [Arthrobacter sp. SO3]